MKEESFLRFLQSLDFQPKAHNAMEGHPFTPVFINLLGAFLEHKCQPLMYLIRHTDHKDKKSQPWRTLADRHSSWHRAGRVKKWGPLQNAELQVKSVHGHGLSLSLLESGMRCGKCAYSYPRAWWPWPLWAKIPQGEKLFDGACFRWVVFLDCKEGKDKTWGSNRASPLTSVFRFRESLCFSGLKVSVMTFSSMITLEGRACVLQREGEESSRWQSPEGG